MKLGKYPEQITVFFCFITFHIIFSFYVTQQYIENLCTLGMEKFKYIQVKMDALNAPNPANPNAQDQIIDAVQGPTNQAQGPAFQNQAQVPAGQIPAQVPAVQVPVQGPAQVGQNIPIKPLQQLVPIQLAHAGIVVPAPQIIYH